MSKRDGERERERDQQMQCAEWGQTSTEKGRAWRNSSKKSTIYFSLYLVAHLREAVFSIFFLARLHRKNSESLNDADHDGRVHTFLETW